MYYKSLKSFFESVIGYNGSSWESDLDKREAAWLSHDMEKMLETKNHVGYPSLLSLLVFIPLLGYCINQESKKCDDAGYIDDFKYFCDEYLACVDEKYAWENKGRLLWKIVRNKLAHVYFTKQAITTEKSSEHLKIKKDNNNYPYLFISVRNLWNDTKKAMEFMYKNISENSKKEANFLKKLDSLDQWQWKKNEKYLKSNKFLAGKTEEKSPNSGYSGPNMPLSGAEGPK